jgi:L-seryl-tRNA(Ser) seleniumtransferase
MLQELRMSIRSGTAGAHETEADRLELELHRRLSHRLRPMLTPVINATGVILHTNLGRAPLPIAARETLSALSSRYTNLEIDLLTGERSHRHSLVEPLLGEVLGCEAATVVNNNAAAVFLILNSLAPGREVIVSRGELVEIGGSFRIPDIMARSGAVLREVGTTNKTRLDDYAAAAGPGTAMLLRVHTSNYRIEGFTSRPELGEMVGLARSLAVPLVEDIGSGCLVDLRRFGICGEPLVQESLAAGVDLVCFSADKLLGGPQAGIIAGRQSLLDPIRKNPLMRTYRVEKLIYGALDATLRSYATGRAFEQIPVLRMLSLTAEELRERASAFTDQLKSRLPGGASAVLKPGNSVVGGGSCPGAELPTTLIALRSERHSADAVASNLRLEDPAIVLRIEEDNALVDLRTVSPDDEPVLLEGIARVLD